MVPRMTVAVAVHKTRSDLLSPGTRVAADVGWGPAPGMTKDNLWMEPVRALPQGQALAGDRCITTTLEMLGNKSERWLPCWWILHQRHSLEIRPTTIC